MRKNINPKVSIIIPVYNSKRYLRRCFDSILKNGYKNLEVIIINDGSTDDSQSVIDDYVSKFPRIFTSIIQKNKGIGFTRNVGIKKATGDYIMFIDNDDFIDNDYIKTYVDAIKKTDLNVVISGYKRVDDNKELFRVNLKDGYKWSRFVSISPWGKIYRRQFLIDNKIEFMITPIGEDVYFNLQVNTITDKIKIIDYNGYNWYYNNVSVTNTMTEKVKRIDTIELLNRHYEVLEEKKGLRDDNIDVLTMYFGLLIIQFLQWISKKTSYKEISKYYDEYLEWFNKKFPNNKKIKYWGLSKGDRLKVRLIIKVFMICNKLKLGKMIVYLYGRI